MWSSSLGDAHATYTTRISNVLLAVTGIGKKPRWRTVALCQRHRQATKARSRMAQLQRFREEEKEDKHSIYARCSCRPSGQADQSSDAPGCRSYWGGDRLFAAVETVAIVISATGDRSRHAPIWDAAKAQNLPGRSSSTNRFPEVHLEALVERSVRISAGGCRSIFPAAAGRKSWNACCTEGESD